jgi:uncharacterized membrane protein
MTRTRNVFATLVALMALVFVFLPPGHVAAEDGWVIRSFDTQYTVNADASVDVVEDIRVTFDVDKHGIFRSIPVEYQIEGDPRHHRMINISNIKVDDGNGKNWKFDTSRVGDDLQIKIGDPDKTIRGDQRYHITYRVKGAFNSFEDHDEFYWNATGDEWGVPINSASASLTAPALDQVTCFQGVRASTRTCASNLSGNNASFKVNGSLRPGEGLTIVAGLPKGAVTVPPPTLKYIKTPEEAVRDFMGLKLPQVVATVLLGVLGIGAVARNWWLSGRDRWAGDVHYLTGSDENNPKPLFAKETVVVEYTPPELGDDKRPLRPAEIGLLLDERADTLDVTATIVDLAVRGYLSIEQVEGKGIFGKDDYTLHRLKPSDDDLLVYERTLHDALFDDGESVKMSDLKNEFYKELTKVKDALYVQGGKNKNKFFNRSPSAVRNGYLAAGLVVAGLGVAAFVGLGVLGIGALLGVPVVIAGLLMAALASAMPRRTALGREYYRRSLGFREYMEVAETDRQRFYEDASIFDKYLPYAIVYGCTEKWARAFEGIEGVDTSAGRSWYSGTTPFTPVLFASNINSFSSAISSSIASVPASSGGSGFSGGGGGGGGFGGGGGGSW